MNELHVALSLIRCSILEQLANRAHCFADEFLFGALHYMIIISTDDTFEFSKWSMRKPEGQQPCKQRLRRRQKMKARCAAEVHIRIRRIPAF